MSLIWRSGAGVVEPETAKQLGNERGAEKAQHPKRSDIFDNVTVERGSWVFRNGKLVPRASAIIETAVKAAEKRSDLPSPMIMSDLDPYQNVLDGKTISSRSEHREFLKRNNLIEVGNEKMAPGGVPYPARDEIGRDIKETIEQLKAGYVNPDDGVFPSNADIKTEEVPEGLKNGDYIRSDVLPDVPEVK